MDYEQLYEQMQVLEKDLRDKLQAMQRTLKSLSKNSEKGEIKGVLKDLTQMADFIKDAEMLVGDYTGVTGDFDAKEYMESGDFARQMTAYCETLAVDIKGEYPVYEIFPYKIKIDSENQELYIDRKKLPCVRPQYFVKTIKQNQDKLNKAAFNVNAFLNELADGYDAALRAKAKNGKTLKSGHDVFLKDIYPYMVPMQRFRREYDAQSYAFDLSRLYNSDAECTKDGKRFEFGPSRQSGKLIRILDQDGNERFLGTIRFFDPEK